MSDNTGYFAPRGTLASEQQTVLPEFAVRAVNGTRTKIIYGYEIREVEGRTDKNGNPLKKSFRTETKVEVPIEYMVYFPCGSMSCTAEQLEALGLQRRPGLVDMETGDITQQHVPDLVAMHEATENAREMKKRGR